MVLERRKSVVLIVEDESLVRLWAAQALEHAGYDVIEAGTADEAIAMQTIRGQRQDDAMRLAIAHRQRQRPPQRQVHVEPAVFGTLVAQRGLVADGLLPVAWMIGARQPVPGGAEVGLVRQQLRDAHRRVRVLPIPPAERQRLSRRLLAICDVSKHDLDHAAGRLDLFLLDLDVLVSDTPSAGNIAEGD